MMCKIRFLGVVAALALLGLFAVSDGSMVASADDEWQVVGPAGSVPAVGTFGQDWFALGDNTASGLYPVGYRHAGGGSVRMRGLAAADGAALAEQPALGLATANIFQLPCGYRPAFTTFLSASAAAGGLSGLTGVEPVMVKIDPSGQVQLVAPDLVDATGSQPVLRGFVSLDVTYDAETAVLGSECDVEPARDLYLAPGGNDANAGTSVDEPLATLGRAAEIVRPGDHIYLLDGTYSVSETIDLGGLSGGVGTPITIAAYPGDHPIIDGAAMGERIDLSDFRPLLSFSNAEWLDVIGLEITGAPLHGIQCVGCQNVTFSGIDSNENEGSGLALIDFAGTSHPTHDVSVVDSDLHHNHDRLRDGGEADGLSIFDVQGENVVVEGVRTFDNSDDGMDLSGTEGAVRIVTSWSYRNGLDQWSPGDGYTSSEFDGSGQGFKLGGVSATHAVAPSAAHLIADSAAWDNRRAGYYSNGNPGLMSAYHNTAWDNGWRGFDLPAYSGSQVNASGNLSIDNRGDLPGQPNDPIRDLVAAVDVGANSWDIAGPVADASDLDLAAAARSAAEAYPRSGSGLPDGSFLHLVSGSDLIDAAPVVADPASPHLPLGSAPDFGAFEVVPPA